MHCNAVNALVNGLPKLALNNVHLLNNCTFKHIIYIDVFRVALHFGCIYVVQVNVSTGGPRYTREIGTPKICSHIMNSNIKRPTITVN
jgi:hypothetical protein